MCVCEFPDCSVLWPHLFTWIHTHLDGVVLWSSLKNQNHKVLISYFLWILSLQSFWVFVRVFVTVPRLVELSSLVRTRWVSCLRYLRLVESSARRFLLNRLLLTLQNNWIRNQSFFQLNQRWDHCQNLILRVFMFLHHCEKMGSRKEKRLSYIMLHCNIDLPIVCVWFRPLLKAVLVMSLGLCNHLWFMYFQFSISTAEKIMFFFAKLGLCWIWVLLLCLHIMKFPSYWVSIWMGIS